MSAQDRKTLLAQLLRERFPSDAEIREQRIATRLSPVLRLTRREQWANAKALRQITEELHGRSP